MENTSMTPDSLAGNVDPLKGEDVSGVPDEQNPASKGVVQPKFARRRRRLIIDNVRNSQHPIKLRADQRARELGKTLTEVYRAAGVNKTYLSEIPKTGWRIDKLRAICAELEWTIAQLTNGQRDLARQSRKPTLKPRKTEPIDLFILSVEVAVHVLNTAHEKADPAAAGRLAKQLYGLLTGPGAPAHPDRRWLIEIGRVLDDTVKASSKVG